MKFPIVILKDTDPAIYFFEESTFGLISKGGEKFYKKGVIYDIEGSKFLISGIESMAKAPFLKSIKYFQQMYLVKVKYTAIEKATLPEFKNIVINHIHSFEKYWIKRDLINSLENSILTQDTFSKIIFFLK